MSVSLMKPSTSSSTSGGPAACEAVLASSAAAATADSFDVWFIAVSLLGLSGWS